MRNAIFTPEYTHFTCHGQNILLLGQLKTGGGILLLPKLLCLSLSPLIPNLYARFELFFKNYFHIFCFFFFLQSFKFWLSFKFVWREVGSTQSDDERSIGFLFKVCKNYEQRGGRRVWGGFCGHYKQEIPCTATAKYPWQPIENKKG